MRLALLIALWACAPSIATHQVREDPQVDVHSALRRAAVREVNRIAGLMGYERWLIVVRLDTLPNNVIARLVPRPESKAVIIPLDVRYFGRYPDQLCEILAHELMHGKLLPLRQALLSLIQPADTALERQVAMVEESVVSDLARLKVWKCP